MKAPVTPSSVMLLASSLRSPTCTSASQLGLFVHIHILHVKFWGKICVLVQQVLRVLESPGHVEVSNGGVLLQPFHDLCSLLGEAIALVCGSVVGLVVT